MNFIKSDKIDGIITIEPQIFEDDRGFFMETYSKKVFAQNGIDVEFVQDNHSRSAFGVLRGLHFQKPPFAQDKLIRVTQGEVVDIAVDIRPNSPTFGQYESAHLSAENKKMFFIPKGFAHGFYVLSETVDFQYKCSNYYNKESEGGLLWNDPDLNITWYTDGNPILSEKDKLLSTFSQAKEELLKINW
jgi:dTDP-4-dehydrorhamnose 3,5-epimerase